MSLTEELTLKAQRPNWNVNKMDGHISPWARKIYKRLDTLDTKQCITNETKAVFCGASTVVVSLIYSSDVSLKKQKCFLELLHVKANNILA